MKRAVLMALACAACAMAQSTEYAFDYYGTGEDLEGTLLDLAEELANDPQVQTVASGSPEDSALLANVIIAEQLRDSGALADGDVGADAAPAGPSSSSFRVGVFAVVGMTAAARAL